ncbi:MAG: peptidoglycan-binding protein [Pseudomonadota bacterium]
MLAFFNRVTVVSGAAAAMASAGALSAQAQPDLVINKADSKIDFISCEESQPLVEGRIVIRNEGSSDANLRSAKDFFRSFVAVYVPENIDLIDKDSKRTKLEPREQRTVNISVGRGKTKAGRNFNAFRASEAGGGGYDPDILEDDEIYAEKIQAFLKSRGYALSVDGDWGSGSKRALKAFQANIGLDATGEWDRETAKQIEKLAGVSSTVEYTNVKNDNGETRIRVFAVVDPYNLISESNEKNNVVSYEGYLKCD